MLQTILTGWHPMRWLRLIIGTLIAIQAIQMHDPLAGLISAFFLYQAVFNAGCCGTSACAVSKSDSNSSNIEEVEFEEIKTKVNGNTPL